MGFRLQLLVSFRRVSWSRFLGVSFWSCWLLSLPRFQTSPSESKLLAFLVPTEPLFPVDYRSNFDKVVLLVGPQDSLPCANSSEQFEPSSG